MEAPETGPPRLFSKNPHRGPTPRESRCSRQGHLHTSPGEAALMSGEAEGPKARWPEAPTCPNVSFPAVFSRPQDRAIMAICSPGPQLSSGSNGFMATWKSLISRKLLATGCRWGKTEVANPLAKVSGSPLGSLEAPAGREGSSSLQRGPPRPCRAPDPSPPSARPQPSGQGSLWCGGKQSMQASGHLLPQLPWPIQFAP